jgi:DNA-binding response OmpR family regulator
MTPKVYYLDDEPHLCDLVKESLELSGVEATTFTDAGAAIEACRVSPPSMIFIDYRLSDTTGDIVAQAIEASIPKVLVSGDLIPKKLDGFVGALGKPFRLTEILALIKSQCGDW